MARIPYPDPASLSPETRDRLERLGSLNLTRMLAHNESVMQVHSRMGVALLRHGMLDPVLREAVILRVGQLANSDYEWYQHESVARVVGMDEAMLAAIAAEDFAGLPEPFQVAIRFAEEIAANDEASSETFAAARKLFSHAEIVELAILIGYYRMTAGVLRSLAIEIEDKPLGEAMK